MRKPSAMPADDWDSGTAQLLGNGGKIEPYTIIIMILDVSIFKYRQIFMYFGLRKSG
jgi:hypothetical protein